mgnify:CR=1 FL=1
MKVYPFQIAKPLHENLIFQEDITPIFYNQLHQHEEIQLSLIVEGKGKLIVGDSVHPFKEDDFFVIGPHSPHIYSNEKGKRDAHMVTLFFTDKTFGATFFELTDLEEVKPFFEMAKESFQVLSEVSTVKSMMLRISRLNKLDRFIQFLQLLQKLCVVEKRALTQFLYPKKIGDSQGKRMQTIFDYTITNFQKEIDLDTASALVYMTPNAFCRFFKQHTNKTYFQFLIELRIEHACQLLLRNGGQLSILEISEKSGFSSISNFNRQFKKFKGIIPSHFTITQ